MDLTFVSIVVENFAQFVGTHRLRIKELEPGLHLVVGRNLVNKRLGGNDVGKSMLWNALSWGLYGRTPSGLKAPDLRPWHGEGTTRVRISIKTDGERHIIERTASPNRLTLDKSDTNQETIDALLQMGFALFRQTVLYGQDEPLFPDLTNAAKMSLLSDVRGLDQWELRSVKASEQTRLYETQMTSLEGELRGADVGLTQIKETIVNTKGSLKEWKVTHRKQVADLAMKLDEEETKVKLFKRQTRDADDTARSAAKKLGACEADVVIVATRIDTHNKKQEKARTQLAVLGHAIDRVNHDLNDLNTVKKCSKCGQTIKRGDVAKHKAELEAELRKFKKDRKLIKFEGNEDMQKEYTRLRAHEAKLRADYETARSAADQLHRLRSQAEASVTSLTAVLKQRREEVNPHERLLKKLRERRAEMKASKAEFEERHEATLQNYERAKYWIKGFKDVRLMIIEELLTELEIATNAIVEEIGLIGWSVTYFVERETKAGTIIPGLGMLIATPKHKDLVKWENWSGGVGQRLRMACAMALSEVLLNHAGVNINLEILDEPTRYFSGRGVGDMIDMLSTRAEQLGRRILYVDHTANDGGQFASTITITKNKEGAYING